MADNISQLEQRINQFEALIKEMKEVTRDAHSALKELKHEHKEIDRMLTTDVKAMINRRIEVIVKAELDKLGPELSKQSDQIYAKVTHEIDKLIDLSLGKDFGIKSDRKDLRPALAEHLRIWIREVINDDDTLTIISKEYAEESEI